MIYNLTTLTISEDNQFNLRTWKKHCINKNAILYVIVVFNASERFLKIGRTCGTIDNRLSHIPYKCEIKYIKIASPRYVFKKEAELHRKCKEYKYKPKIEFSGMTECYDIKALDFLTKELNL